MIPERYFYYPEIVSDDFADRREDISDLISQARQIYDTDDLLVLGAMQSDYESELKRLVMTKRKLLLFGCQMQGVEKQRELIEKMASDFHLEKRLLRYREVYR